RWLWLRATGSTFGSQFIDTLVVLSVAFAGQLAFPQILAITLFNYGYKFAIAIAITPLIYLAHWLIDAYLGRELAHALIERAAAVPKRCPSAKEPKQQIEQDRQHQADQQHRAQREVDAEVALLPAEVAGQTTERQL